MAGWYLLLLVCVGIAHDAGHILSFVSILLSTKMGYEFKFKRTDIGQAVLHKVFILLIYLYSSHVKSHMIC